MSAILQILIPTFNRAMALEKNLGHLKQEIGGLAHPDNVEIFISDNCSQDETRQVVKDYDLISQLRIKYHRQQKNIGLEANVLWLLKNTESPYILWCGDDDFLSEGYLDFVLSSISDELVPPGLIIPGLSSLLENGILSPGRAKIDDPISIPSGFEAAWAYSHLAHQMSGLVMKREGLYEHYVDFEEYRNPYLFIHLATYELLNRPAIYAPSFDTKVTVFNAKDWSYNEVGLLDEVFKSYYPFKSQLGEKQLIELLIRFSIIHSYRYDIKPFKPGRLLNQFRQLNSSIPFKLEGFKSRLGVHLVKDYLLSWKPL
ncbi:MAG: glycosyltransferase [Cyclobacteriaceae bacterium]